MALDILTTSQGGTRTIIQAECCVFIPDESSSVSSLLKHMNKQVNAISDPAFSLEFFGLLPSGIGSLFRSGLKFLFLLLLGMLV